MRRLLGPGLIAATAYWSMCWLGVSTHPQADGIDGLRTLTIRDVIQPVSDVVPVFSKYEVTFNISGTIASNLLWPYDSKPPSGVPPGQGITVSATFTDPTGRQVVQPAFHATTFTTNVHSGRDWLLPSGVQRWYVRFSPNRIGLWSYTITARDGSGTTTSPAMTFTAVPSDHPGFIRVSRRDSRYFEFANGTLFAGFGFEMPELFDSPFVRAPQEYQRVASHGVNFVRVTLASIFGSAWTPWIGGRNQYRGYLPVTGLVPIHAPKEEASGLALKLDYEPEGDAGWFDACRLRAPDFDTAVRPHTLYRISVRYRASNLEGPRVAQLPSFGLVVKLGGWHPDCHEPGTGNRISAYGGSAPDWQELESTWFSGSNAFLPRLHLGLENIRSGEAHIAAVSVREVLDGGALGPNILSRARFDVGTYVDEQAALAFDHILRQAEQHGVYLKLVVGELNDKLYLKMADNGDWVSAEDNADGYYGLGRAVNRTRWLQQAWWRYVQARWGYSPHVHSWELLNEGDPSSDKHYEMADEFGKFMHCRVFDVGVPSDANAPCSFDHPNAHLVTTSFWHSFPADQFWKSDRYPNIDYADLHAYVSTSFAPLADRALMQFDAAAFHVWHSRYVKGRAIGKPVVRGEAGLDSPSVQREDAAGLENDASGTWLHNFLWSTLDSGGLYELYWWRSHIWNEGRDLLPIYGPVVAFVRTLPLNRGGYQDWGGRTTSAGFRVLGQKNPSTGNMHLWIQNRAHTWKNVADGVPIRPISGSVVVGGFAPGAIYRIDWFDTWASSLRVSLTAELSADSRGEVHIAIDHLSRDVALTLRPAEPRVQVD